MNKKVLFQDVALSYIKNKKLTKNTLKGYKSQLKYNILPYFGEIQINKISYEMIIDFMQKMKEKYKHPKPTGQLIPEIVKQIERNILGL